MSYGVGHRRDLDPTLLWLLCRPAATALIRPLAWGPPHATEAPLEMAKRQKKILHLYVLIASDNITFLVC